MARPSVREKLLAAGLATLHRHGFNGAAVQDITDAAGVPKGSFYNHFESKEALGLEILDRYWRGAETRLAGLRDAELTPVARLRRYFETLSKLLDTWNYQRGCLIGNFSAELSDQSPAIRARLATLFAEWRDTIETCIAEGQEAGEIQANISAATLAAFMIDAWEGAILRAKVEKTRASVDQFMTVTFSAILA